MVRKPVFGILVICLSVALFSCGEKEKGQARDSSADNKINLAVLDPGHYHAALVQKTMYEQVDPVVHVYAPDGPEVQEYLKRIDDFNSRAEVPTSWQEKVYTGDDYLAKMVAERKGNVVVLSGNNRRKAEYIKVAVDAGLNVFSDKPMCIDAAGFRLLEEAFASAEKKGLLVYDMMTERFNIFRLVQKMLVLNEEVFGELKKGTAEVPAVVQESVHHLFKYVAGKPIKRPKWYFDTAQQGEGLVDVTTHLIDLAMWTCFPEQAIDYRKDVSVERARRWPTMINRKQYEQVTGTLEFPDYLESRLNDEGALPCFCNGEMAYSIKGVHMRLSVTWDFQAPEGASDAQSSSYFGTRATVILEQGAEQGYRPQLYVEPAAGVTAGQLSLALKKAIGEVQSEYPGLSLKELANRWQIAVPDELQAGHEAHFRELTERYLRYLAEAGVPAWEVPNTKAKYYITTTALELARQSGAGSL